MMLSSHQLSDYQAQGYLILKNWISDQEIQLMRDDVTRMTQDNTIASDVAYTSLPDGRKVINRISRQLAHSETMRQVYGNPKILSMVASLYGPDFLPFAESIVIKMPTDGAPFPWHQDGQFKTGPQPERGLNVGIYLYPSNETNGCLYVIPGSHVKGQIDISKLIEQHGQHLPNAIPVSTEPGDVVLHSRNLIHGSFPNTSPDLRVTVYFGFHARKTVQNVYPLDHIAKREAVIPLCIQCRKNAGLFSNEAPYHYQPQVSNVLTGTEADILNAPALTV
jgi:ectoine hydroxylase-related dioxygenase (phytanoyl-CoA dioxygenase family)